MIKIVKDNNEFIVTKGVYENKFKDLGYEIVSEKKPVKEAKIVEQKESTKEVVEEPATSKVEDSKSTKTSKFQSRK